MKVLALVGFLVTATLLPMVAQAQSLPRGSGYVVDTVNVIDSASRQRIEQLAAEVERRTGAQIAVAALEGYGRYGFGSIEQLGIALAEQWGVGDSDADTGVILLLALEEREVRIEVGYGLEGALPDGRAGAIIDQAIIPAFQAGRYGEGFLEAARMVASVIGEEYGQDLSDLGTRAAPTATAAARSQGGDDLGPMIVFILVFIFFGGGRFFFWPLLFGSFRRGFYGGGFGTHHRGYTRTTTFRGGGSFRGGGGGFGGFGGGGFGGGGASRGF